MTVEPLTDEYVYLAAAHRECQALIDRHNLDDRLLVEIAGELVEALSEVDEWGALVAAFAGADTETPVAEAFIDVWLVEDRPLAGGLLGIIAGTWCPVDLRDRLHGLAVTPDQLQILATSAVG